MYFHLILPILLDLTRSLQHKHEMLQAFQGEDVRNSAPGGQIVPSPEAPSTNLLPNKDVHSKEVDYSISPLAEPQSNLPLWRRVDRRFWWNEIMAKPFTDAGVGFRSVFFRSYF